MILMGAFLGILASIGIVAVRGIVGPTAFDRILAANMFGTNIIVLIVLVGHWRGSEFFIDIALTYALVNFVSTMAFLRYFKYDPSEK